MTGTPAPSRAATMFRTLSTVNWCLIACEPSRSEESVTRTSRSALYAMKGSPLRAFGQDPRGEPFPDPGGGGGHDVEVARVRRGGVAPPLDLDQEGAPGPPPAPGGGAPPPPSTSTKRAARAHSLLRGGAGGLSPAEPAEPPLMAVASSNC